jgi:DNA repair exonuclease SbcCD ATPase subunit
MTMEQSELRGEIRGLRTLVETHKELKTEHLAEIKRLRAELAESQRQAAGYAEAVVDYEQQVHELRALVAEYDYCRNLNLTDLATLQTELRAATQENERLRSWAAAWKAAAKYERAEAMAFEAALTAAEERAEAVERKLAKAEVEIERLRTENTMLREAHTEQGWVCPICGRALAMWVSSCDHDGSAPATRTAASDAVQWEKTT